MKTTTTPATPCARPRPTSNTRPNGPPNKFRIDMLFNGGGSVQYAGEHGSDPLLTAFQKYKGSFGWVSHTWDHPNLDIGCASQSYIEAEQNENNSWGVSTLGLTASSPSVALGNDNPSVIVTGEHSGLANLCRATPASLIRPTCRSPKREPRDRKARSRRAATSTP
jgi:hypothetical protein